MPIQSGLKITYTENQTLHILNGSKSQQIPQQQQYYNIHPTGTWTLLRELLGPPAPDNSGGLKNLTKYTRLVKSAMCIKETKHLICFAIFGLVMNGSIQKPTLKMKTLWIGKKTK